MRKAHSPDAGHASGLRAEFASLQLTGNDLSLGLQLPGQTFKLQLLQRGDRGGNVVYLLTATLVVISSVIPPPPLHISLKKGGSVWLLVSRSASFPHWFKTLSLDMLFNRDAEGSATSVVPLHKTQVPLGVVNKADGSDCQTNKLTALTQCTCLSQSLRQFGWYVKLPLPPDEEKFFCCNPTRSWHSKIRGINLTRHQIIEHH